MPITMEVALIIICVSFFTALIGFLAECKPVWIGSLSLLAFTIALLICFDTHGVRTDTVVERGEMQSVDNAYMRWAGKYNNHLKFYVHNEGEDTIEEVSAENYSLKIAEDGKYTYEKVKHVSKFLFFKLYETEYILYVPDDSALQEGDVHE